MTKQKRPFRFLSTDEFRALAQGQRVNYLKYVIDHLRQRMIDMRKLAGIRAKKPRK